MPEVHLDYAFFRNEEGGESVPVVVLRDRDTKAVAAHETPYKGGDHEWTVSQCARDLRKWGIRNTVILKSDQEHSICAVAQFGKNGFEGKLSPRLRPRRTTISPTVK